MSHEFYEARNEMDFFYNSKEEDKAKLTRLMNWSIRALKLSVRERTNRHLSLARGEIWNVDLGENVETEMNKCRPCLIIQSDELNKCSSLTIVMPITSNPNAQNYDFHAVIKEPLGVKDGNSLSGTILPEQIRGVSKGRLLKYLGRASEETMKDVEQGILYSLGMNDYKPSAMQHEETALIADASSSLNYDVELFNSPNDENAIKASTNNQATLSRIGQNKTYPHLKGSSKKKKKKK